MRVCMLTYSFYELDARVQQYATALLDQGHEVDVIALRRAGMPRHETLSHLTIHRIQYRVRNERGVASYLLRIGQFLIHAVVVLARAHRARRYQIVHVHSVPDFLVFAAIVPRLLGARIVLDIHDILPEFYASKFHADRQGLLFKVMLRLERLSVKFADYTIVANDLWCARVKGRSGQARNCIAIRNYPDPQRFFPRHGKESNGSFVILYPGTLNSHQGLDVAIRAFARVQDQIPGAEFQIYGEGPSRPALVKLADQLGLGGKVVFNDPVPADRIADIMAGASLAVVPKRASSPFGNEAASTKIFEFMALGVPLVVSRTRIDSYYLDDSLVRFFESENEEDLAHAIVGLAGSPELRRRLAARGLRYAAEHSWANKKHDYLRLVDSLTCPGNAQPLAAAHAEPAAPVVSTK